MATAIISSTNASNGFTAADHIRTQVDAAVSQFYSQMNEVQVDLHKYEKIPSSNKTSKAEAAKNVQASWDKASAVVQNLRELRDTLQHKESEAVYNYQMNDGVWKNGQTLQDIDGHISDRHVRLDSARQLALQSEQQQRRQVKIKWMYVILFIVLLGAAVYMYIWSVGDEIGIYNSGSVEEANETPEPNKTEDSSGVLQTLGNTSGISSSANNTTDATEEYTNARGSTSDLFSNDEAGNDSSRRDSSSSESTYS